MIGKPALGAPVLLGGIVLGFMVGFFNLFFILLHEAHVGQWLHILGNKFSKNIPIIKKTGIAVNKPAVMIKDAGSNRVDVDIELTQVNKRLAAMEKWKAEEIEPWRNEINLELDTVKVETRQVANKIEAVTEQIKKIQNTAWWVYMRDVMIISLVILMFIFIIIFSIG